MIRFIHAADLHLQAPFSGLSSRLPAELAAALVEAPFGAWDNIVKLAIAERVDAVLVAGDAYDDASRSLRAQRRFVAGLQKLEGAGIRSLVICGNHDPLDGWDAGLEFPPGCHRFGPKLEMAPLLPADPNRVWVYGASYQHAACPDNLVRLVPPVPPGQLAIGLIHCWVGSEAGEAGFAPCLLGDFRGRGVAYWALGHVHLGQVLARDPWVVYPGCPQGLRWSQTGAKGVYLVELDQLGGVNAEFQATDCVRFESLRIDIAGLAGPADLSRELLARLRAMIEPLQGRPMICRIELEGSGDLHRELSDPSLIGDLRDDLNSQLEGRAQIWCDRILVKSRPPFDRRARRKGNDLVADLLELSEQYARCPEDLPGLEEALGELYGNDSYRRQLAPGPDRGELAALLVEAEIRALDLLEE